MISTKLNTEESSTSTSVKKSISSHQHSVYGICKMYEKNEKLLKDLHGSFKIKNTNDQFSSSCMNTYSRDESFLFITFILDDCIKNG